MCRTRIVVVRALLAVALVAILTACGGGGGGGGAASADNPGPPAPISRVSVNSAGNEGNLSSDFAAIIADGRYVAFQSAATDLVTGDTNVVNDIFVRDTVAGTTERISVSSAGAQSDSFAYEPAISGNGRYVAFYSNATNLVAVDANANYDVFLRDRTAGTTVRVSVDSSEAEATGGASEHPAISGDGRYVAFESVATNLVAADNNGVRDVFVRDTVAGTTERVSVDSAEAEATGISVSPAISADGRYVAFASVAGNLVTGDTNSTYDVFLRDRTAGTTERVSVDSDEGQATGGASWNPAISADGRYVVFESSATDLVVSDTNSASDVFLRDRLLGTTVRVSVDSAGSQADEDSYSASISLDGRYVSFVSSATSLVSGDTNGLADVFVRDTASGTTVRASVDMAGNEATGGNNANPTISADGRYVAFDSEADNLVTGDTNIAVDVFRAPAR